MRISCPVCGETAEVTGPDAECGSCGAFLTPEILQTATAVTDETAAAGADLNGPTADHEVSADELEQAFRMQFDGQGIHLPQKWIARLRTLATEAEASRRFATAFFIDLRGYTALSRLMAEDQMDRLRQWFYGLVTRRVEQYGGFVIQFIGDAVFAAFGAPWAFERDSESALRALLEIREDIRKKGTFEGYELAIRAGADFGPINVRLTDVQGQIRPDLFGSTVNLAARLEAQAETWEILISENLAMQVRDLFDLELKPAFVPKNYGREVVPRSVVRAREDTSGRRSHDLPFIGRQAELEYLARRVERTIAGEFSAVQLLGDAGLGKSRLVRELQLLLDRSGQVHFASAGCEPHSRFILFHSALQLVRHCAGQIDAASAPELLNGEATLRILEKELSDTNRSLLPTLGYLLGVEPHVTELKSLPPKTLRSQAVVTVASLFIALADRKPWLLYLDDIQWCDRLTMDVVDLLLERRPPNLMLLVAGREHFDAEDYFGTGDAAPGEAPGQPLRQEFPDQLILRPLGEPEQRELLSHIITLDELHPLLQRRLFEESEGVPFYLIEIARDISERGSEPLSDQLAEAGTEEVPIELPAILLGVLQARLDTLSGQQRAILQCGSILGRRFSYRLIALYEALREDLLGELYAMKGLRLVRDEPVPEDIDFIFTPTALRNVAYHMLTQQQRESLHRTVAQLIEKVFADRQEEFLYDLAFHWSRGRDADRARPYIRRAVQQNLLLGVPQEAYELLKKALQFAAISSPGQEVSSLLQLQQRGLLEEAGGKACRIMGDFQRAREHFSSLLEIASSIGNRQWETNARYQLAVTALETGDLNEAKEMLDLVLQQEKLPAMVRFRARNSLAVLCYREGKFDEARSHWSAVAEDTCNDTTTELIQADCLNNLGLAKWHAGELTQALDTFRQALGIWEKSKSAYGRVITLCNMGIIEEKLGSFAKAMGLYDEAYVLAEQIGFFHGLSALEANRANIQILLQDFSAAQIHSARALRYARLIGQKNSETVALNNLGLAQGGLGLIDDAFATLGQSLFISEPANDLLAMANARLARVSVAADAGRWSVAHQELELVKPDLPSHLMAWSETLRGILDTMKTGMPVPIFMPEMLDDFEQASTPENILRRLDAVRTVKRHGGALPYSLEELESRRARYTAGLKSNEEL